MKQVHIRVIQLILPILFGLTLSLSAFAQDITVRGSVMDEFGEPVIGANISVKGTTIGTITDFDGIFQLQTTTGSIISVSFIGYQPIEVEAQPSLRIVLREDAVMLESAVVIGYGTAKKSDVTGSVTAIKPDEMNRGLVTNAQDMIAGKIAGVSVISEGGEPGGAAQIRIRGGSSLSASNDPLIVIDGLAMDNDGIHGLANALAMVNPNDIETFTVLKDASATAIYGSRASNGVIIITTKKGSLGKKPQVSYNGNMSISTRKKSIEVMDGNEFREYAKQIMAGNEDALAKLGTANTNWQDEIFRTGISHDHNLSVSGGIWNLPYRVSFGYTDQQGILKTSDFERYTLSFNLSPTFFDRHLTVNLNAKGMIANTRFADKGAIGAALAYDPTQPVYASGYPYDQKFGGFYQWYILTDDEDPESVTYNTQATQNPVSMLELKDDRSKAKNFIGNAELDYKFHFLPDLRVHLSLGMDYSTGKQTTITQPTSGFNPDYGRRHIKDVDKYNKSLNFWMQYAKDFEKQRFDVMAGYEWQHFHRSEKENGIGLIDNYNPTSSVFKTESYLVSFFGRANYTVLDRYMLTFTLRNDGTSRFHEDVRWGLFPSVALGWRIKEEAFLQDVDVLSDLKLRLGYGITGQQNLDRGDYPYIPVYSLNKDGAYYMFGDEVVSTYRPDAYNRNLKWEETTTWNIGIDYGFFNGRLNGSVDYYFRKTKDLINVVDVSAGTNFKNRVISNIGSLENEGVEVALNGKVIDNRDFMWELGYNITYNRNEITKLTTGSSEGYYVGAAGPSRGTGGIIQAHAVGFPASSFYVYQQVYDSNGKPIENTFVDRNGDGIINDDDRYFYKSPAPDVLMGLTSKMTYRNWDLGFSLRASFGNYVYDDVNADRADLSVTGIYNQGYFSNRPVSAYKTNFSALGSYHLSDYYIKNASFLRCDNITLGYSFNKLFNVVSGRIYATVQNPFVITKYKGIDPEIKNGLDNNIYPRPLVSLIGLSLNF